MQEGLLALTVLDRCLRENSLMMQGAERDLSERGLQDDHYEELMRAEELPKIQDHSSFNRSFTVVESL